MEITPQAGKDKQRIALFIGSLQVGGSEQHVIRLLAGLQKNGFWPTLILNQKSGSLLEKVRDLEISILELPLTATIAGRIKFIREASQYLRENQIDIVQAYNDSLIVYVAIAARLAGTKKIFFGLRNTHFFNRSYWYKSIVGWTCRHLTNGVITNSNATARLVNSEFNITTDRIRVAYNGISTEMKTSDQAITAIRKSWNISKDDFVVGMVARLEPVKKIDILIRAAQGIHDLPVKFFVLGDGDLKETLTDMVNTSGLKEKFIFAGRQMDINNWLKLMDIGVSCSSSEGFPQNILEFMASGLPVIAPRVGGIPELVIDGQTGIMIDEITPDHYAQVIRGMLQDEQKRISMGMAGKERVKQLFSPEKEIAEHINAYQCL